MINQGLKFCALGLRNGVPILLVVAVLSGCRGESIDDQDEPRFPLTENPDTFIEFLNASPGQPRSGVPAGEVDNVNDFPEAYYNTIDPQGTRDSFEKWRIANGFLNVDGSEADCDPSNCITTHVRFRDDKDLGYGRNMFMRRDLATGDVAVYVENYQVDVIPGVPYSDLNLTALVNGQTQWNFGVNAIEYSAFPATAANATKFTKFYNFVGEGGRSMMPAGALVHFVDLDGRGEKPVPGPCIVCHGGHGRTLVVEDVGGRKVLAPTITGGVPGDLQAHMQIIEEDTLQFADAPGFRRSDNADGIRLINDAVLSTYQNRQIDSARPGDWDPAFAIEILEGRYGGQPGDPGSRYSERFVPSGWTSANSRLYSNLVGPNCVVCHQLRGSQLNPGATLSTELDFMLRSDRIHELVFERGRMPAGLLNYANFWENPAKEPAAMAAFISHPESFDANLRAFRPGAAVAALAAPPVATGVDSASGEILDIPLSGRASAFASEGSHRWSVAPESLATVVESDRPGEAVLRAQSAGEFTVSLEVTDANGNMNSTNISIDVQDASLVGALPAASAIRYYGAGGIDELINQKGCLTCHSEAGGIDGIPIYYEPCRAESFNGYDFVYRSVLSRVNFDAPEDSLFLRKPTNGATDLSNIPGSQITGYHQGGSLLDSQEASLILAWILSGAERGPLPAEPIGEAAPECVP